METVDGVRVEGSGLSDSEPAAGYLFKTEQRVL
jgi:hypothetical protein